MPTPRRLPALALATGLAALFAGCATVTVPPVEMHAAAPAQASAPPRPATTGAIFQASTHRPLFEDRRARLAGDTLTILIEEQVSASQQSTSKIDRTGSVGASATALPFASTRFLGRMGVDANASASHDADGKTGSNNSFSCVITVQVKEVLPNGNLLVVGEKQIGVNQNVDVMRFSGIVNPSQIRAGNVVSSTQVAEARLEQRGRGDVSLAQGMGWLLRFFLSIAPI